MELVILFLVLLVLLPAVPIARRLFIATGHADPIALSSPEARLAAALKRHGVTLTSHFLQNPYSTGGYGYDMHYIYGFTGIDASGIEVGGTVEITGAFGGATVTFNRHGAAQRTARALARQQERAEQGHAPVDPEEEIQLEVARRLDAMQADRAAFLASDTNRDGLVDDAEWAATRARVEAEVRAERGSAPAQAAAPADAGPSGESQW